MLSGLGGWRECLNVSSLHVIGVGCWLDVVTGARSHIVMQDAGRSSLSEKYLSIERMNMYIDILAYGKSAHVHVDVTTIDGEWKPGHQE